MIPGEIIPGGAPVPLNPGRGRATLIVTNTGDRPVQVGSHYHFAAANPALEFDREAAWGRRLDVGRHRGPVRARGDPRGVAGLAGRRWIVPGLRPEQAGPLDSRGPGSGGPA